MPNGYPQDWILGGDDIAKDISEDMVCSICSDLKRDAVITDCKHSFCGDCIAAWFRSQRSGAQTCPNCRTPHTYTHLAADTPMRAAIGAMQAKCPHCSFADELSIVYEHEMECSSRPPDPPRVAVVDPNDVHGGDLLRYGVGGLFRDGGIPTFVNQAGFQYGVGATEDGGGLEDADVAAAWRDYRAQVLLLAPEATARAARNARPARTCRCAICIASTTRFSEALDISGYLSRVAQHIPALKLRVVSAPRGKNYFFVTPVCEGAARDDCIFSAFGQTSNAFIHMTTYTNIVNAIRIEFSCSDRAPITRPLPGDVVMGVLGRDREDRLRVDEGATRLALIN